MPKKPMTAADMARKRWEGTTAKERSVLMTDAGAKGGTAAWANMTPEERSAEMKRRRRKSLRKKAAKEAR